MDLHKLVGYCIQTLVNVFSDIGWKGLFIAVLLWRVSCFLIVYRLLWISILFVVDVYMRWVLVGESERILWLGFGQWLTDNNFFFRRVHDMDLAGNMFVLDAWLVERGGMVSCMLQRLIGIGVAEMVLIVSVCWVMKLILVGAYVLGAAWLRLPPLLARPHLL